jgi:hypothetical protein
MEQYVSVCKKTEEKGLGGQNPKVQQEISPSLIANLHPCAAILHARRAILIESSMPLC